MRLIKNAWTTAETTFAGTTAGLGGASSAGGTYGVGTGFKIDKIIAQCGGSSAQCNTSGMLLFRYGDSSNDIESTMVVLGGSPYAETSVTMNAPQTIVLDDLNIRCNWFQFASKEDAAGGWNIFVFGD